MPHRNLTVQQINQYTDAEFLYQHGPCGYVSFDADGKIICINETFCLWLGLDKADCIEKPFTSLLNMAGGLYFQMVVIPMLHQHGVANEINFKFGFGEVHFDGLFNAVLHKNEKLENVVINAAVHKIPKRKRYEADLLQAKHEAEQGKKKFEFLSNSIPNLIWTVLPSGEINFVNQRFKDYFKQDGLQWYNAFLGFPETERDIVKSAWHLSIQTGTILDLEANLVNHSGKPEWFLFRMEPFRNEQGEIELWFGSATTIHENKMQHLATQSQLTQHLSTAHKTIDENKGVFTKIAYNQSHMIRKPLANILGLIPLLQEEPLSAEGRFVLKCMLDSAEELDYLVKKVVKQTEIT